MPMEGEGNTVVATGSFGGLIGHPLTHTVLRARRPGRVRITTICLRLEYQKSIHVKGCYDLSLRVTRFGRAKTTFRSFNHH